MSRRQIDVDLADLAELQDGARELVQDIRLRIHDAPLPAEYMLDEAANMIERLLSEIVRDQ